MIADGGLEPLTAWIERSIALTPPKKFFASVLRDVAPQSFDHSVRFGFLVPAGRAATMLCRHCSAPHDAQVEYDHASHRYFHICPENVRIDVDARELDLVTLNLAAVSAALSRALGLDHEKLRSHAEGMLIELGVVAPAPRETAWTACVAFGLARPGVLRSVLTALEDRVAKDAGYVFTSSRWPEATPLPRRHRLMSIADAFRFGASGLEFVALPPRAAIGRRRTGKTPGPSSSGPAVIAVANALIERGARFSSIAALARAVSNAWDERAQGRKPSVDTISRHLRAAIQNGELPPVPSWR